MRFRWALLAVELALVCSTSRALAADEAEELGPFRRFGVWDYVATGVVSGGYYLVELTQDGPRGADWTGPLPLDRPVRDAFAANTRRARDAASSISDGFWYASVAYPVLDAAITPALRTRAPFVSWHMTMMNFQAFMTVSLLIRMPHKWIGRQRPDAIGCADDASYTRHCGNEGMFVSFPGGHVAVSMTGAGLSCAHHVHGKLYGSALADGLACGTALGAATTVGYFRMRADAHWLSDQLVGIGAGLFAGYLVPTLLYYHPFWSAAPKRMLARAPSARQRQRWTVLPLLAPTTLGASLVLAD
jgi:membrane-associated phospholipid phosphatase